MSIIKINLIKTEIHYWGIKMFKRISLKGLNGDTECNGAGFRGGIGRAITSSGGIDHIRMGYDNRGNYVGENTRRWHRSGGNGYTDWYYGRDGRVTRQDFVRCKTCEGRDSVDASPVDPIHVPLFDGPIPVERNGIDPIDVPEDENEDFSYNDNFSQFPPFDDGEWFSRRAGCSERLAGKWDMPECPREVPPEIGFLLAHQDEILRCGFVEKGRNLYNFYRSRKGWGYYPDQLSSDAIQKYQSPFGGYTLQVTPSQKLVPHIFVKTTLSKKLGFMADSLTAIGQNSKEDCDYRQIIWAKANDRRFIVLDELLRRQSNRYVHFTATQNTNGEDGVFITRGPDSFLRLDLRARGDGENKTFASGTAAKLDKACKDWRTKYTKINEQLYRREMFEYFGDPITWSYAAYGRMLTPQEWQQLTDSCEVIIWVNSKYINKDANLITTDEATQAAACLPPHEPPSREKYPDNPDNPINPSGPKVPKPPSGDCPCKDLLRKYGLNGIANLDDPDTELLLEWY